MIYLDYAAATPIDSAVFDAMRPYFAKQFYNPSASYQAARRVRADYEAARRNLARWLGAKPAEIIMTAGATESINLAVRGVSGQVITTAIEHPAVLAAARRRGGQIMPVDGKGRISLGQIDQAITEQTELISIGYANSEIGTVQPIREVAELVRRHRQTRLDQGIKRQLLFHVDASQAAGYLDLNTARLGVDLMTLNAGKCYGPKQVGLLFIRAGVKLQPLIDGGGQEMGLRSGTENVAGAVGFSAALALAESRRSLEVKRLSALRDDLERHLLATVPGITINGDQRHRLPSISSLSLDGLDGERALFALDQRAVAVATGSACAASQGRGSHVLAAIGLADPLINGSLRLSLGRPTLEAEIDQLKPILTEVLSHERGA